MSEENIKSKVADWVKAEVGWKDYRMELSQVNEEGKTNGWRAIVYRSPETPGDHVTISLDASGRIMSTNRGR